MDVTAPDAELTSKLTQMQRQPFGLLEDGSSVDEIKGNLVRGVVDYMLEYVGAHVDASLPAGTAETERRAAIRAAETASMARLAQMLNDAIRDEQFHVTPDYLLDAANRYTTEFWLFTADYCRVISGDADFFANYSRNRIPAAIVQLMRPLSLQRVYQIIPQIARYFSRAEVHTLATTATSATLRWYGYRQEDPLLNEIHMKLSSVTYRNFFSSVPQQIQGLPPATIEETHSMLDGSDYYEWILRWQEERAYRNNWLLLGLAVAAALTALQLWIGIPITLLLALALLAPIIFGWSIDRFNRLQIDHNQKEALLEEQHKLAEQQYEESQQAQTKLQGLNIQLQRKVNEISALNEIGAAISATLDLEELLEASLRAVTENLHFDRALALLLDEEGAALTHGASVGGSTAMAAAVAGLSVPLAHDDNFFVQLYRADRPAVIRGPVRLDSAESARFAEIVDTQEHLGTPLISKGRRVGVLSVDNRYCGRLITEQDAALMFLVAGQIAVAIDNALLYREVERQKQTLEQRVAQRTEELAAAMQTAEVARRAAEEANAAKSIFLSNVSHELRTPLTSVLGFARVIRRALERRVWPILPAGDAKVDRAVGNVQENLDIIISEGERLTALINEVLDLAKIEAGKVEWSREELLLNKVVQQALQATSALADEKGLTLRRELAPDLPPVVGDRNKLMQVIINLISNAVKFTASGDITCRTRPVDGMVEVSVSDTGIGIPAAELAGVFEVFRQVGDTLTDKPQGSGLGLAICREIVEQHGGRIWVESEVGQGSTFTFALPAG